MKYDYLESIKEDVKNYIKENKENESYDFNNLDELKNILYDDLFIDDSVTGNASGSYYCNSAKAREAVQGNEELLINALIEFENDAESYKKCLINPEFADVTIRCYLLSQAIDEVVEDLKKENSKTIIKIKKFVKYTTINNKNEDTVEKELFTKTVYTLDDAIKILNDEKLSYYNSKFLQVSETIETFYKMTESSCYKKLYKTIDAITGDIKKNY